LSLAEQIVWLLVLAIPIACVTWTFTHEEILREFREFCTKHTQPGRPLLERKFFFALTCEYCLSHYVTVFFLFLAGFPILWEDWRGYLLALFTLVWLANFYMSAFARLRLDLRSTRLDISREERLERELQAIKARGT
jgi:hypothetical protein